MSRQTHGSRQTQKRRPLLFALGCLRFVPTLIFRAQHHHPYPNHSFTNPRKVPCGERLSFALPRGMVTLRISPWCRWKTPEKRRKYTLREAQSCRLSGASPPFSGSAFLLLPGLHPPDPPVHPGFWPPGGHRHPAPLTPALHCPRGSHLRCSSCCRPSLGWRACFGHIGRESPAFPGPPETPPDPW